MTRQEQVAAEIDMHAEMLLALGQRLDLVLHRVGQRRTRNDALGIRRAGERSQEGLRERAVLPFRQLRRQFVPFGRGQHGDVFEIHGVLKDLGVGVGRPAAGADRARMARV